MNGIQMTKSLSLSGRNCRFFYCATVCNATHGIAVAILSVCLSLCLSDACIMTNETIICQYLNSIRNKVTSSLSTPTEVAGNYPLLPEIFAESDPPPSKNADFDRFPLMTSQP